MGHRSVHLLPIPPKVFSFYLISANLSFEMYCFVPNRKINKSILKKPGMHRVNSTPEFRALTTDLGE